MREQTNTIIRTYYSSMESRLGYRLFLGGTRHFGFYTSVTAWPWPVGRSLRAMEAKLLSTLSCPPGSKVLDAGCGIGHVSLYMAKEGGFSVEAIDLTPHHVTKAARKIRLAGLEDRVSVRLGDYHDLGEFGDSTFEAVYTMETLVHAAEARKVLEEFYRVLKPGGYIGMHEYDHSGLEYTSTNIVGVAKAINESVGLVAFESFGTDDLLRLVKDVGFEDVTLVDMSDNIVPMLWLFYIFAYIPYRLLGFVGLRFHFPNVASGVALYVGKNYWRYVQVKGRKPSRRSPQDD